MDKYYAFAVALAVAAFFVLQSWAAGFFLAGVIALRCLRPVAVHESLFAILLLSVALVRDFPRPGVPVGFVYPDEDKVIVVAAALYHGIDPSALVSAKDPVVFSLDFLSGLQDPTIPEDGLVKYREARVLAMGVLACD